MKNGTTTTSEAFVNYQQSVASRLRYKQAQKNLLALHNLTKPIRVLDAAGGNGLNTEFLIDLGHNVTLMDSDPAMLEQAHARLAARDLLANCQLVNGPLEQVGSLLAGKQFDLILCHHVIEYLDDVPALLRELAVLSGDRGELSLITINPVSEVIRAVIFNKDPTLAESRLTDLRFDAKWFGNARLFTEKQVVAWAHNSGWNMNDLRAIRVLADYIADKDITYEKEESLLQLEEKLANMEPYKYFGRYLQFAFSR